MHNTYIPKMPLYILYHESKSLRFRFLLSGPFLSVFKGVADGLVADTDRDAVFGDMDAVFRDMDAVFGDMDAGFGDASDMYLLYFVLYKTITS